MPDAKRVGSQPSPDAMQDEPPRWASTTRFDHSTREGCAEELLPVQWYAGYKRTGGDFKGKLRLSGGCCTKELV